MAGWSCNWKSNWHGGIRSKTVSVQISHTGQTSPSFPMQDQSSSLWTPGLGTKCFSVCVWILNEGISQGACWSFLKSVNNLSPSLCLHTAVMFVATAPVNWYELGQMSANIWLFFMVEGYCSIIAKMLYSCNKDAKLIFAAMTEDFHTLYSWQKASLGLFIWIFTLASIITTTKRFSLQCDRACVVFDKDKLGSALLLRKGSSPQKEQGHPTLSRVFIGCHFYLQVLDKDYDRKVIRNEFVFLVKKIA